MIGGGIALVLTLFTIGYLTLTTPEPVPDDIYTIMQKAKAKTESDKAGNSEDAETAVPDNATLLPDGTFDFGLGFLHDCVDIVWHWLWCCQGQITNRKERQNHADAATNHNWQKKPVRLAR